MYSMYLIFFTIYEIMYLLITLQKWESCDRIMWI